MSVSSATRSRAVTVRSMLVDRAKRFIKAELIRQGITYAELARRLTRAGVIETEGSVTVKINRGGFPTWWTLVVLEQIGLELAVRDLQTTRSV